MESVKSLDGSNKALKFLELLGSGKIIKKLEGGIQRTFKSYYCIRDSKIN